jgi:hypothetical protein
MDESAVQGRRPRGAWLGVGLLVAIVVASLLLWRASRDSAPVNDAAAPVATASSEDDNEHADDFDAALAPLPSAGAPAPVPRAPPAINAGVPAADLPPAGTPVRDAVSALAPLVEQGRADATHRLAMELVRCQRARNLGSDEVIRERLLRRYRGRNGQNPASDAELDSVAREIERLSSERDRCAGIEPDMFASRLDLLEKAAHAGNTDAMLDYVDWGLQDMAGYDSLLRNFDEVARRRTLAAGFLNRALSLGDCRALGVMAEAYAGGRGRRNWVYTANPYNAAVYGEAAALVPGTAPVSSTALNALDPQQQANARDQAMRLVQRHCGG